jgi:S1-C subfamily serine protease
MRWTGYHPREPALCWRFPMIWLQLPSAPATLAVLKLQEAAFPVAEIGDAAALRVGHVVLAVARPGERDVSTSWGVISALGGP